MNVYKQRLKINVYGEGIRISKIEIPALNASQWNERIQNFRQPLADLLLDPFFYHQLKIPSISSYVDLTVKKWEGINCTNQSLFEIWSDRKKIYKNELSTMQSTQTLFPLFNLIRNSWQLNTEGMYIIEREKGLIRSCIIEHPYPKLLMDDFTFQVTQWENNYWLEKLFLVNEECISTKSDTVITQQYVL
jgi:hypothetical protein